jgi:pilus assembly protein CpaB
LWCRPYFEVAAQLFGTDAQMNASLKRAGKSSILSRRPVMRAKSVLLLLIALGCGVVASVAVSQVVLDQNGREDVQTVGILVVAKDLSAATKIPPGAFKIEQWPVDRVPVGAITDPKAVENKFTKQRLYAGEPIIEAKLSVKGKEFSVPAGFRIFDIVVRDESGGGGYIGPGDHVDVFGYFEKGNRINAAKSVKVMENLEVVMIDGVAVVDPESTTQKKSSTIQLLVKDSQYVVLDTAANLGKLRLALRPPEQAGNGSNRTDDGESFMSWLKESEAVQVERTRVEPIQRAMVALPEKGDGHEMTIISANKSTKYKWVDGQMIPQVPNSEASSDSGASGTRSSLPSSSSYRPTSNSPSLGVPASTQSTQSAEAAKPVDPANSVQSNMTLDPASGSWQSGGFKATYPGSK